MNTKYFLLTMLCMALFIGRLLAIEVEPNNTPAQASTLVLSSTDNGSISPSGDVDWWKLTTTGNGMITLSLTSVNGIYITYQLYDNDAVTLFSSTYTAGTSSFNTDGLAAGTYYIKVFANNGTDQGSYTLSNSFTAPPVANDVEPDNKYTQAKAVTLGGSKTGQVGYYYNHVRDTTDWFKVVTTGNGQLTLSLTSQNGHYVTYQLIDGNGSSVLISTYTAGTSSQSLDGLAAGTYYIKIFCNSNNDFASYTIGTSFTAPPVANDNEPDDKSSQANVISLNGSTTGQIGYYYNAKRDTFDWYKFTTNADGLVKISLTSENGHYVTYQLYDNDAVTLLNSTYTAGNNFFTTDGLAAGTYYVKIYNNSINDWASYLVSDSLFKPAQANDPEPNGSKSQAVSLTVGGTVTGHIGYYYNHVRDTTDWYKLTTSKDGMIGLSLTSNNGHYVTWQLLDNNGTTVLNSTYTAGTGNFNTDGLAAGTYYVKIYNNSINDFAPYTLTNTLTQYHNNNDGLSNDFAKQAATLPANGTTPGHVGFYYNGSRDLVDWWKINYTGSSGNLTITINQDPHLINNSQTYLTWQVYLDTAAAPIYGTYFAGATNAFSFTGLTQPTYYYIKIYTNSSADYASYNINPVWTQTNKATITLQSTTTGTTCTNGSISYKCAKSHSPYTVQLYRYELAYGSLMSVKNTSAFSISNLPPGLYHATVYGDGATGTANGKTSDTSVVPTPTNTATSAIKKTSVTFKWDSLACIKYYSIQYRVDGTIPWTTVTTTSNKGSFTLKNLIASTTYDWQVASVDTGNKKTAVSAYLSGPNFTTLSAREEQIASQGISVYPNPASSMITLAVDNVSGNGKVIILNMQGQIVQQLSIGASQTSLPIDISLLSAGMYQIRLIDGNSTRTLPFEKQ